MGIFSSIRAARKGYKLYSTAKKDGITPQSFTTDIQALFRMLVLFFKGEYQGIKKRSIIKIVLAIIYLISFIDFIPDFIPFIGWADDIAVLFFIYRSLKIEIDAFLKWEQQPKIIRL